LGNLAYWFWLDQIMSTQKKVQLSPKENLMNDPKVKRSLQGILAVLIAALLLAACSPGASENTSLNEPLIVWLILPVQFMEQEEEIGKFFDEWVDDFLIIHPEVTIIHSILPHDELLEKFKTDAQLGLGPDLMIGPSMWVPELAEMGLIQDLSGRDEIDTSIYFSTAVRTLRYKPEAGREEGLYGLPMTLGTYVLYYNKDLVNDLPPTTLPALLGQAAEGKKVALDTSFLGAFWGIQAFGGQLIDQEGRVVLDQGGFANWLGWLKAAQHNPNIILNNNPETLLNLFLAGKVAYWVGDSSLLMLLRRTLGEDVVGVASLPAGPNNNPAGPFLYTAATMFNAASSPAQTERALKLARFLTNVEQQTTMVLQSKFAPANQRARIDPRVAPAVAAVATQTKTAVPLLNIPQLFDVLAYGDDVYVRALAGDLGLNEAAAELTERVNARYGFETGELATTVSCDFEGTIEIWHSWSKPEAAVLARMADNFTQLCPTTSILLTSTSSQAELYTHYRNAVTQDQGPDLLSLDTRWVVLLAADGLLHDLTDSIEPAFLQRYVPGAQETMRYKGRLYGLPVSMEPMALYYNTDLVTDPARDLADLLNQAAPERQVVLPIDFLHAYWGVPAFGGRIMDAEYRVVLDEGGFAEWLNWLQAAQDRPGMVLTTDLQEAIGLFVQGKAAYLAGYKELLNLLQMELGAEKVGVVPLPAGPKGESGPYLGVEALLLNPASAAAQRAQALGFAKYVASLESQTLLMEQANRVPANVNVDTTAYPAIGGFLDQAGTSFVPANEMVHYMFTVLEWGDDLYAEVLLAGQDPVEAANNFSDFVNLANGFTQPPVKAATAACAAAQTAHLLLWHSWSKVETTALEQIIVNFTDECPGVQVEIEFVPAADLLNQLAAADRADAAPDFFLAPHELTGPLREAGLIKEITPLVDQADLAHYLTKSTKALRNNEELYGLPQSLEVMALYYNTALVNAPDRSGWQLPSRSALYYNIELINSPAGTLDELLTAASPTTPVAVDTSFYGAFWGVPAFGGQLLEDEDGLTLDQAGFEAWLTWLQAAQDRPGVLFGANQAELQDLFVAGEAAYMVAGPDVLNSLQAAMGAENVGVALLPSGPAGEACPFLRVEAFLFSAGASEKQTKLALTFARFATSETSQTLLRKEANLVPTNKLAVEKTDDPAISSFLKQALRTGVILPHALNADMLEAGDRVYRQVLAGTLAPEEAVNELSRYQ
jgi:ABC-type glycerol-3-phosphate transport system substrate-binding protein